MVGEHPSLQVPKKTVPEIRYVKADEVYSEIKKLIEQLQPVDVAPVMERLANIEKLLGTLITLMEKKVELDALEADVLELLKAKMAKGT